MATLLRRRRPEQRSRRPIFHHDSRIGLNQGRGRFRAYFGGEPSGAECGRIVIYKAMCDLLWTLWGLIQHANRNPVDDFWKYSLQRFERCKQLMGDPQFAVHLRSVCAG